MKTNLLTVIALLIIPSTQVLARPSISELQQGVNALTNDLVVCPSSSPTRFVDNGDGTICDRETGLMWEMKNDSDDAENFTNPSDLDNRYIWSNTGVSANGTLFREFLARMNGELAGPFSFGTPASGQLGGYSDWRVPTLQELQSIVDCSFDPCINPLFGPTVPAGQGGNNNAYWTSTSLFNASVNAQSLAWFFRFNDGARGADIKTGSTGRKVRAVRSGR